MLSGAGGSEPRLGWAPASSKLLGIGKVEQKGNRLVITSGDIICPERNNTVIAKALGTFNAYPAEKAGFENKTI